MTGGAFGRAPVRRRASRSSSSSPAPSQADTEAALQHLLNTGVISQVEFQELRARVTQLTGPVQVLVVGFDRPTFSGEVLAEFTRLREAGIVRLVDLLVVSRTEDGAFETLALPEGVEADLGDLAAGVLGQPEESAEAEAEVADIGQVPQRGPSPMRYPSAEPRPSRSSSTPGRVP